MQIASTLSACPVALIHGPPAENAGGIPALVRRQAVPTPRRSRREREEQRYYVGRRPEGTEVFVVTGSDVMPLVHHGYQSDAAFDWGDLSAGALELAFALLIQSTERRPPDTICAAFCADVVGHLDRTGFLLGDDDIALWLTTALCDSDIYRARPPGWQNLGGRVRGWLRARLRRR
jgi:hypothetical protein